MEAKLSNDSVKGCEKNDSLSLRMKSDHAKVEHDELAEKIKIMQHRVFTFLRESIREVDADAEDAEEETKDKSEFVIRKKESEEELEGEETERRIRR